MKLNSSYFLKAFNTTKYYFCRVINNTLSGSTDQYYNLRFAKEDTATQTKSNSRLRIVGIKFISNPYIRITEVESLVSQIVTALRKIKDVFIIVTSRLTENEIVIPALSRIEIRAKKEFDEMKLNLSIYNNGRLKKVSVMEAEFRID